MTMLRRLTLTYSLLFTFGWLLFVSNAQNLETLLKRQEELSIFLANLEATTPNLYEILSDRSATYTIFAPGDRAIEENPRWIYNGWEEHLVESLRSSFIPNTLLTETGIAERTALAAAGNPILPVETDSGGILTVGGVAFARADLQAVNGILHIMVEPIPTPFDGYTLADLINRELSHLKDIIPESAIQQLVPTETDREENVGFTRLVEDTDAGTTFLACNEAAYENINTYLTPRQGFETMREEFTENAADFFAGSTLPRNFYSSLLSDDYLALTASSCGTVWVSMRTGKLCFQDSCVVGDPIFARNGLAFVTDQCLVCYGVVMLAGVDPAKTTFNTTDFMTVFKASGWNPRDMREYTGGQPVTLFAPVRQGWADFEEDDWARLLQPEWKPHVLDLLQGQMVLGAWKAEDLIRYYDEVGAAFELETLNGESLLIDWDVEANKLYVGEGERRGEVLVSNLQGIDGVLHLSTNIPTTRSVTQSLFQVIPALDEDFSTMYSLIDRNFALESNLKNRSPRTVLIVPNRIWDSHEITADSVITSVLQSHVFAALLTCDILRNSVEDEFESLNGNLWTVSIQESDNAPCLSYSGNALAEDETEATASSKDKVCLTRCDVPAKNGVAHVADGMLGAPGVVVAGTPVATPPTSAPVGLNRTMGPTRATDPELDIIGCYDILKEVDSDSNGALLRPEYFSFIAGMSAAKCQPAPGLLTYQHMQIFSDMACRCKLAKDADPTCCQGTHAAIVFTGNMQRELCERIDRSLPSEDMCTGAPAPVVAPTPTILTESAPMDELVILTEAPMSTPESGSHKISIVVASIVPFLVGVLGWLW